MASPVTPQMVEPLLISKSDTWCVVFKKLFQSFYYAYLLARYFFNEDGEITTTDSVAQFGTDICSQTVCADEEGE